MKAAREQQFSEAMEAVLQEFPRDVSEDDILGPGRLSTVVEARQSLYAILRALGWSWYEVGEAVGGRGHQPAIVGARRIVSKAVHRPLLRHRIAAAAGRVGANIVLPGEQDENRLR